MTTASCTNSLFGRSNTIAHSQAHSPADATSLISKLDKIQQQISSLRADLGAIATNASASQSPLAADPRLLGTRFGKSPGRHVVEDATGATIYLGSHSDTPLALGCRQVPSTGGLMQHDSMADQFVPRAYPFTNLWGAEATIKDIYETLPDDSDIIRYASFLNDSKWFSGISGLTSLGIGKRISQPHTHFTRPW